MRWSIIRLIWLRELRDQLRDRRTIFMIAVLPILLYPVAGYGVMHLALGFLQQKSIVGIAGADNLLPWRPPAAAPTPGPVVAWLSLTPPPPGAPLGAVARFATAAALAGGQPSTEYPPLVEMREGKLAFSARYTIAGPLGSTLLPQRIDVPLGSATDPDAFLAGVDRTLLNERKIDVLLVVPPGFQETLARQGQATLFLLSRAKDDNSRLVDIRVTAMLNRWKQDLKQARLARAGLPSDFDEPIRIHDPERAKPPAQQEEEGLFSLLVRIFPFVLVMWSLAGALYPAVDLCAGEKERGTMETLLISPASREEIVSGKFLAIWVFSAATALLNLLSMAITTWQFSSAMPGATFRPMALFWGVLLLLPLSAFFSALCLSVGAYARSSKEGQYYLMPLFLVTLPLIFLTLAPGVELNAFYSMVPVTGVALLLQKLMAAAPDRGLWLYFVPVLAPMVIYSWLALRWAIAQFQREEVLFREAERLDLGLWLRRLLREKEALPSAGEAIFCFVLILGLRWLSFGLGQGLSLLALTGISYLAFVATPPLFMSVMLTTRPRLGLGLRWPAWWALPAALLLALAAMPPLAELTGLILRQFPALQAVLEQNHPLTHELQALSGPGARAPAGQYFLVLALLPALCEELAFRGFILTGLLRGFREHTAILLSAFLFALYQMNFFQLVPHFVLGVLLALLAARAGSVLPAMLFHLAHNTLLMTPILFPRMGEWLERLAQSQGDAAGATLLRLLLSAGCLVVVGMGVYAVWRLGEKRPAEETAP
jgi:sodium transport system permease protein